MECPRSVRFEALSLKVVDHDLFAYPLEYFLYKLHMIFVDLIGILRGLVLEDDIECYLITLIDYWAIAGCHPANMEILRAWNVLKVSVRPID